MQTLATIFSVGIMVLKFILERNAERKEFIKTVTKEAFDAIEIGDISGITAAFSKL